MVIFTNTFTAEQNQPIYENKQYRDLPEDTRIIIDALVKWVYENGKVLTNYHEDTLDVQFIFMEDTFSSFKLYADSITGGHETFLSNYATVQSSIGFKYTNKIEIFE